MLIRNEGVIAAAGVSGNPIGGLIPGHAINTNVIWALSSHPSGSPLLGTELVSQTAATLIGSATWSRAHPDNAAQLGLDAGDNEGVYASAAAIFANVTTDFSLWMDLTIDSVATWGACFSLRYNASGWTAPFSRFGFVRSSSSGGASRTFFNVAGTQYADIWATGYAWATPGRRQFGVSKSGTTVTYYISGSALGTGDGGIISGVLDVTGGSLTQPLTIFNRSHDSLAEWVNGGCHGARVWNRALVAQEFADLTTNPRLGTYTS